MYYIIAVLMSLFCIIHYTPWAIYGYAAFVALFFSLMIYLVFKEKRIRISINYIGPIIIVLLWLTSIITAKWFQENYWIDVTNLILSLLMFIFLVIMFSNFKEHDLKIMFEIIIKLSFIIASVLFFVNMFSSNTYINENSISLIMLPYFIFKVATATTFKNKIIIYFIGVGILFLTDGRTAFLVFTILPFLSYISKKRFSSILTYLCIMLFSIFAPLKIPQLLLEYDDILSLRPSLWISYMENIIYSKMYWLGSNDTILVNAISIFDGINRLNAHNTYIHMLWQSGIFYILLIMFFFVLIALMKNNVQQTLEFRLIVVAFMVVQAFEVIKIPEVSYISVIYMMSLFMILKKEKPINENLVKL